MIARRAYLALAFLAIVVQAGCAFIPAQQTPIDVTVSGVVMDLKTQQGISATITVEETASAYLTDANGRFSFTLKSEATYTLRARAAGYVDSYARIRVRRNAAGPQQTLVSFTMAASGSGLEYSSICGRVTDRNGLPLSDALVVLDGGKQTNGVFASKMTDTNGYFFAYGIPTEDTGGKPLSSVWVMATKAGYRAQSYKKGLVANETIANVDFVLETMNDIPPIYEQDFETDAGGWTATGFWHRQNNDPAIVNKAYLDGIVVLPHLDDSLGRIPFAYSGNYCFWYGDANYGHFGGSSLSGGPQSGGSSATSIGTLTSPAIALNNPTNAATLRFMTWFEIESVNPNDKGFDLMIVSISTDGGNEFTELRRLNPYCDPPTPEADRHALAYTSGGFNQAANWIPVTVDLSDYLGKTILLRFTFDTHDGLYNGFRGWFIDDIRICPEPALPWQIGAPPGTPQR